MGLNTHYTTNLQLLDLNLRRLLPSYQRTSRDMTDQNRSNVPNEVIISEVIEDD